MKRKFQDVVMQGHYELLVKTGVHYRVAERETIKRFYSYDHLGDKKNG